MLRQEWHGVGAFVLHGLASSPFWLAVAGIAAACVLLPRQPGAAGAAAERGRPDLHAARQQKYYFDRFNDWFFAGGARRSRATSLSSVGDRRDHRRLLRQRLGPRGRVGGGCSMRRIQTGYCLPATPSR